MKNRNGKGCGKIVEGIKSERQNRMLICGYFNFFIMFFWIALYGRGKDRAFQIKSDHISKSEEKFKAAKQQRKDCMEHSFREKVCFHKKIWQ